MALSLMVVVAMATTAVVAGPSQAASPGWRALAAPGPTNFEPYVNDRQTVVVSAKAGTFQLTVDGSTTPNLPFDVSAPALEEALNTLPAIAAEGGSVSVTGGVPPDPTSDRRFYIIEFDGGPLAGEAASPITATNGTPPLSGGTVELATGPTPAGVLAVYATNVGGASSDGPITATVGPLPPGVTTAASATGPGWSCSPAGAGHVAVTCTNASSVAAFGVVDPISVPLQVGPTATARSSTAVTVEGGGATEGDTYVASIAVSSQDAPAGTAAFWAGAFDADGRPATQAGGHPYSAAAMFLVNTKMSTIREPIPVGDPKDVIADLPPGFIGNPLVTERCPATMAGCGTVRPEAVVGFGYPLVSSFPKGSTGFSPVSNDVPRTGYPAQLTFPVVDAKAMVVASVRMESDYGVTAVAPNITPTYKVYGSHLVLYGNPAGADGKAFLTNPTDCAGSALPTWISGNTWQNSALFSEPLASDSPPVTGCHVVPFDPEMTVTPTSAAADSASGLEASIDVPQDSITDPNALATSHLKKTVVGLPPGLSVNPSAATGLKGCSDVQVGLKSKNEPSCPDASKLGMVEVTSPLVDQPLDGVMYLGTPKSTDPQSGDMLRLFLVVRNDRYGILVKLPGSAVADPQTGRLTATFDQNPRLPFDHLEVELRGGSRGLLANPPRCNTEPGQYESVSSFTPWSRSHLPAGDGDGTQDPVNIRQSWTVDGDCSYGFNPGLKAGMSNAGARKGGTFGFEFSRPQGDQTLKGLTAELPKGLLASVKDLPLCADAQAAAGACPAASRIGLVDASAGSGDPFVLEEKGEIFLTEGYKGGPYGLMVKVRAIAGPFRGAMELSPIVVRQKIEVDPATAQVRAISDPFPTVWHGVPLRVRRVLVNVDRPNFMINPSDCSGKQVTAHLTSIEGTVAERSNPFQASGCAKLPFKPKLALSLTGRKQVRTGKHPGIRAVVTQTGKGEAGIERAEVRLPKSLALDVNNANALCEFVDGTKPDLEKHCPKGSIVGRARATSPLLNDPLVGNVYFVKNIRKDPKTGNEIRTLPMIIVALRGEIAINLKGESDTKKGKLVNTFASVPDAPVSQFNLNINGGSNGILAVTRTRRALINLCTRPKSHVAEADMDGANGRRHDRDIRMKTPCSKKQTRNAKKAAKRAQARKAANARS